MSVNDEITRDINKIIKNYGCVNPTEEIYEDIKKMVKSILHHCYFSLGKISEFDVEWYISSVIPPDPVLYVWFNEGFRKINQFYLLPKEKQYDYVKDYDRAMRGI